MIAPQPLLNPLRTTKKNRSASDIFGCEVLWFVVFYLKALDTSNVIHNTR